MRDLTSKTWTTPEREPAARRRPSERKDAEVAVSVKAEMVDLSSRVWEEKILTVAECVAAKSWGEVGEKERRVMEEIRVCVV